MRNKIQQNVKGDLTRNSFRDKPKKQTEVLPRFSQSSAEIYKPSIRFI